MKKRKKKSLISVVNREIKKIDRLIKKLSLGNEFEEKILLYKQIADTLMANLHLQKVNDNKIEITTDWFINLARFKNEYTEFCKWYQKIKKEESK